jgi:hypothetical protein
MKASTLADHRGTPTPFFPGLEVVHVDEHGQEHRGVITTIDAPRAILTLVLDDKGVSRYDYRSSSCYVPEDANVRIVVNQVETYTFNVPLDDLDIAEDDEELVEIFDDWFCNQENNIRDARTYEVNSREIESGINR